MEASTWEQEKKANQYEQMIRIAKMYYMEDMSQQKIAEKVNMSRSNISRILKSCKRLGIVEVRIHEASLRSFEVKKKLMSRFGIETVIITPRVADSEISSDNVGGGRRAVRGGPAGRQHERGYRLGGQRL